MPWINHSWHTCLYVYSRGLTTGSIPLGERSLTIDIDFFDHKVVLNDSTGRNYVMALLSESVSHFYEKFLKALAYMRVDPGFDPRPNECADFIPFAEDTVHDTYNSEQAQNYFQVLIRANNVMQIFRSKFVGKCSPVHFFWGSFDLAVTRFSGRLAPEHPGVAPHISPLVMKEAYSHEVSSCGFWPGNGFYPHAAFYSYAYPTPEGFSEAVIMDGVFFHKDLGEYILPLDEARKSPQPEAKILNFFQAAYNSAADFSHWDRERLEESPFLQHLQAEQVHQYRKGDEKSAPRLS
jgi:hypothetical protein